jgi:ribonuclease PH
MQSLLHGGVITTNPLKEAVAAVSAGIVNGTILLDLNYEEDSSAEVDMNFVMTSSDRFVEIQGTAEATPFSVAEMDEMRNVAMSGIRRLFAIQEESLRQ